MWSTLNYSHGTGENSGHFLDCNNGTYRLKKSIIKFNAMKTRNSGTKRRLLGSRFDFK